MNPIPDLQLPVHGGDISAEQARFGDTPPWLDFSANINPLGPPAAVLEVLRRAGDDIQAIIEYPTRRERLVRNALAQHHGQSAKNIVIANGSAALIEAFVRVIAPRCCLVPQPAFSEYERALAAQNTEIIALPLHADDGYVLNIDVLLSELHTHQPDAIILTNPHNPSGAILSFDSILRILAYCKQKHIAVIIDEAFIDYSPEASLLAKNKSAELNQLLASNNLLIMRSLTKFYAMPGLRVGYGVASSHFAQQMTSRLPSWPITALAIDAAIATLDCNEYAQETRITNSYERAILQQSLEALGFKVAPAAANFLLITGPWSSTHLAGFLAEYEHIAVRDCSSYTFQEASRSLRVAVRSREDNARLIAALSRTISLLAPN